MERLPSFLTQRNLLGIDLVISTLLTPFYLYSLGASTGVEYMGAFGLLVVFYVLKSTFFFFLLKYQLAELDLQQSNPSAVNQISLIQVWKQSPSMISLIYATVNSLILILSTLTILTLFQSLINTPWASLITVSLFALAIFPPSLLIAYALISWTVHPFAHTVPSAEKEKSKPLVVRHFTVIFAGLLFSPALLFLSIAHDLSISSQFEVTKEVNKQQRSDFLVSYHRENPRLSQETLIKALNEPSVQDQLFLVNKRGRILQLSPALKRNEAVNFEEVIRWVQHDDGTKQAQLVHKREAWVASTATISSQLLLGTVTKTAPKSASLWGGAALALVVLAVFFGVLLLLSRLVLFEPFIELLAAWRNFLAGKEYKPFMSYPIVADRQLTDLATLLRESQARWTPQNEITHRFGHLIGIPQSEWTEFVGQTFERSHIVSPLVEDIHTTLDQFCQQSDDLNNILKNHTDQWTTQTTTLEEVSSVMSELRSSTRNISSSIELVLMSAERTKETAKDSVDKINLFSEHTQRINKLLQHIEKIARQARMLSLNATIEAMRTGGETSQGFHVIANEMRSLSLGISSSVNAVQDLIEDIGQFGEITRETANQGQELAHSTTQSAKEIATVTRQQQIVAMQLTHMLEDITQMADAARTKNQNLADISEGMNDKAERLSSLAHEFTP
ncbi:MAG: methyl-accepting chemotaxis protein [Planctomycetota bacterium]|nr:methyl-accepting chemotaxis protein [Planctomycetota bacterium]